MLKSLPIILMVVFICSQSFAMLPQESASWQGEVKMAAAHDANHDINQFLWFTAGLGMTAACVLGTYIGSSIIHKITYSPFDYDYSEMQPLEGDECLGVPVASVTPIRILGYFGGASTCGGLSFLGIYTKPSNPPSERFIGKSPEYVESYMAAYSSKARSIRIKSAAAGTATGCSALLLFILVDIY